MKLLRIEVQDFRALTGIAVVDGLGDGLTVLAGDNEEGKSTLLNAIRTVLFERHKVGGAVADAMQPFGSKVRPKITLDFEIKAKRYRLTKAFCTQPMARLTTPDGQFNGSEAESRVEALLNTKTPSRGASQAEHQGVWGLLWVEQGRGFDALDVAPRTQQTLRETLERHIGRVLAGSYGEALVEATMERKALYFDKLGRPRGDFRKLSMQVQELERDLEACDEQLTAYNQQVEQLDQTLIVQKTLVAQGALESAQRRLAKAQAAADKVNVLRQSLKEADADAALKRAHADKSRAIFDSRQSNKAQLERLQQQAVALQDSLAQKKVAFADADSRLSAHKQTREQATRTHQAALAAQREVVASFVVDNKSVQELMRLQNDLEAAQARLDAASVLLEFALGSQPVHIDGTEVPGRVRVDRPTELHIGDLGTITVHPGDDVLQQRRARRQQAHDALTDALGRLGLQSVDEAEALLAEREQAYQQLVDIERNENCDTAQAVSEASAMVDATSAEYERARLELAEAEAEVRATAEHLQSIKQPDLDVDASVVEASAAEFEQARRVLQQTQAELSAMDPERIETELSDATEECDALQTTAGQLQRKVDDLRLSLTASGRAGLGETREDTLVMLAKLRAELQKMTRDARAARLLADTLQDCAEAARGNLLDPVYSRVQPYLMQLLAESKLRVDEALNIVGLDRGERTEPFENLSVGTREQVAVLTRLALSDLLLEDGHPAPVLLDDALVYSDEKRFAQMKQILKDAATRHQILIFTCRPSDWADVGRVIQLSDSRIVEEETVIVTVAKHAR